MPVLYPQYARPSLCGNGSAAWFPQETAGYMAGVEAGDIQPQTPVNSFKEFSPERQRRTRTRP